MFLFSIRKGFIFGLLLLPPLFVKAHSDKIVTIIGTGYVGLVSGACLADLGNPVICADIDSRKIELLQKGIMPIYESGLSEIVERNVDAGRLMFTDNVTEAIQLGDIIFIAVGTPMGDDGSANLSYIYGVVRMIAENINSYKIIVTKSTVPVGTGKEIRAQLEEYGVDSSLFSIVSNPEFLREGLAINDFLYPDRLVIGTDSDSALIALCEVYETLITGGTPYVLTDVQTAEMIKYAANAFLAVKISYINEIANLCDATDADVKTVAYAMGLDHRISPAFLNPGPGFGGSCFPKDAQAIIYSAHKYDLPFHTVQAALDANVIQQGKPVEKLQALIQRESQSSVKNIQENLEGKTVAVLGLAFKADTDDVRYSPAIRTISLLLELGAVVKAYDPVAMNNMHTIFPDLTYCSSPYLAATEADAVVIMTDWDEIKQIDFARLKKVMRCPMIVDARNVVNPEILKQLGFACDAIGQSYLCKKRNEYVRTLFPIHLHKRTPLTKFSGKKGH